MKDWFFNLLASTVFGLLIWLFSMSFVYPENVSPSWILRAIILGAFWIGIRIEDNERNK